MYVLGSEFSALRKLQYLLATVTIAIITNIIIVISVPKQQENGNALHQENLEQSSYF
jgi:hypothetical protein